MSTKYTTNAPCPKPFLPTISSRDIKQANKLHAPPSIAGFFLPSCHLPLRISLWSIRLLLILLRRWRHGRRRSSILVLAVELTSISLRRCGLLVGSLLLGLLLGELSVCRLALELLLLLLILGRVRSLRRRISTLLLVGALGLLEGGLLVGRSGSRLGRELRLLLLGSKLAVGNRLLKLLRLRLALELLRRSVHGLGLGNLGFHLVVVGRGSGAGAAHGEATFLTTAKEHEKSPDKGGDEEDPTRVSQRLDSMRQQTLTKRERLVQR